MTEHEWLTGDDPAAMLAFLKGKVSSRKLHLFTCGYCRAAGGRLRDRRLRDAVQLAEHYADGLAKKQELAAFWAEFLPRSTYPGMAGDAPSWYGMFAIAALMTCPQSHEEPILLMAATAGVENKGVGSGLIRCVFGNPFDPAVLSPSWLTSTVVGLASAIYDARAFHDLPILADALMDAGCDDESVLAHCRGEGPHCRGCFVIDMLTNRA